MQEDKDLKMIEEHYEYYKKHLKNYEKDKCLTAVYYEIKRFTEALGNVIARYKELEENQIWSEATIEGLKRDYIPKSKVKEKIDEYKTMYNILPKNPKEHPHSKSEYQIAIGVLEELIED